MIKIKNYKKRKNKKKLNGLKILILKILDLDLILNDGCHYLYEKKELKNVKERIKLEHKELILGKILILKCFKPKILQLIWKLVKVKEIVNKSNL